MAVFQSLAPIEGGDTTPDASGTPGWAGPGMAVVDPGMPVTDWWGANHDLLTSVWKSQPAVRKVLDFKARQVASIALHAYERVQDGRLRDRDSRVARMLPNPSGVHGGTAYRFWHTLLLDRLIYDRWCALKLTGPNGSLQLRRIPPRRWKFRGNLLDEPVAMRIAVASGEWKDFPLEQFVFDYGYAQGGVGGTSPVLTLADLIAEQMEAVEFRRGVWSRGARVSGTVNRDKPWSSPQARDRFIEQWKAFTRGGAREGGTALLEDGMKYEQMEAWSPTDVADLEGRRLTDIEVASFFHVPPEMVGVRQANYSSMDALRQMLYGTTLSPDITAWEQAVNSGLADQLADSRYLEANVESKLRGSFIEQAQVLSSATGAPYMLRSEARDRMNLPPTEGADELVVPLNVLIGGQASPRDSVPPSRRSLSSGRPQVKAAATDPQLEQATRVIRAFFARQGSAILSRLGAGEDWRDPDRWDGELATDIQRLYVLIAVEAAKATLEELGFDPEIFDEDRIMAFLREAAERSARSINDTTFTHVEDALAREDADPADVLDHARDVRSAIVALAVATFAAAFGSVEAGRQASPDATKTWLVNSSNPRDSHAAMNGETVPIDQPFSNGLDWPAAFGPADEVANCQCSVMVSIP